MQTARQINPFPYHASYFGHKLHVDQNEKLVMFGVTHIKQTNQQSMSELG